MFNTIKRNKKRGFTLIELIIVIAIIAILAAIAVPAFGQIRQKANVSADLGNARSIYSVVTAAIADESIIVPATGTWYALETVGEANNSAGTDLTDAELAGLAEPVAYQGTEFYVNIDYKGNIEIAVSSTDLNDDTNTPAQSNTTGAVFQKVYPTPTGRYADVDSES